MSLGFKLIIPGVLALYLAAACTPDLDSLSASYSATGGSPGAGGDDPVAEGGTGNDSSNGGRSSTAGSGPAVGKCVNLKKDSNESDVDCGGTSTCDRCAAGASCTANKDCDTDFCKNNHCAEPTCTDQVQNQDETGKDCGGGGCKACDLGVACSINMDCTDGYCADGVCTDHCLSSSTEADETDKNCGGATCEKCADKLHCLQGADCISSICSNNACVPATCSDGAKNQDESDTDCGGACVATSKACPVGARCNTEADCGSWVCSPTTKKCLDDIVVPPSDVIDDFEDSNFNLPIPALLGRVGNWYPYGDMTGTNTYEVLAIKRGASLKGMHTTGKDFKTWGSGLGVDLNNSGGAQSTKASYDGSAYSGVTFWARAATALTVTVVLPDADTDAAGGKCNDLTTTPPGVCDHHYYKAVQVTPNWQRFTVAFADLTLEPAGVPVPTAFKSSGIVSVQFRFAQGQVYDLYIDDVAFVKP